MKPKLSFHDLLEKLYEKGISNGSYSEEEIISYLRQRSYYYKISSYRKNFPKLSDGKYSSLTFDHLTATANLDVRLREYLLNLCLDVEHATRTSIMTTLTDDENEDGYTIIENYQDYYPEKFQEIMSHFRTNSYKKDMFRKRTQISSWVFMEIIDYGALVQFLEFYLQQNPESKSILYPSQHKFIKNIRNACAHNNVFLINLFDKTDYVPRPEAATKSYASTMKINLGLVHYPKVIDIINLFYLHTRLCSPQLNQRRYTEGLKILRKYEDSKDLLSQSTPISKIIESILRKSIDFLSK